MECAVKEALNNLSARNKESASYDQPALSTNHQWATDPNLTLEKWKLIRGFFPLAEYPKTIRVMELYEEEILGCIKTVTLWNSLLQQFMSQILWLEFQKSQIILWALSKLKLCKLGWGQLCLILLAINCPSSRYHICLYSIAKLIMCIAHPPSETLGINFCWSRDTLFDRQVVWYKGGYNWDRVYAAAEVFHGRPRLSKEKKISSLGSCFYFYSVHAQQ